MIAPDLPVATTVGEVKDELERRLARERLDERGYWIEVFGEVGAPRFRVRFKDRPAADQYLSYPTLCGERFCFTAADIMRAAVLIDHEADQQRR